MIHPLFRLIASEPQMLADHVEAYSDLVSEEVASAAAKWKRQAVAAVVLVVCALVTILFAGVSVMLWAVTPPDNLHTPWALVIVPLVPAFACVWAWFNTRSDAEAQGFVALKAQFAADAAMLRSVSQP